ncbi:hypothetical protein HK104_006966, partial [Borealophlyctis nickersoniae]
MKTAVRVCNVADLGDPKRALVTLKLPKQPTDEQDRFLETVVVGDRERDYYTCIESVFPVDVAGDDVRLILEEGVEVESVKLFEVPKKPEKPAAKPKPRTEASNVGPDEPAEPSLGQWAVRILETPDPAEKVRLTLHVAASWRAGEIAKIGSGVPPDQPAREDSLEIVAPGKARKLGKGGSV